MIREAIDLRFDDAAVDVEMAAAARLLSLTSTAEGVGEGPRELKDLAATAIRAGFADIVSSDPDFDGIPGLTRIAPSDGLA